MSQFVGYLSLYAYMYGLNWIIATIGDGLRKATF